mmetsp:Transcript_116992/g.184981  ORF Transcript_116992/g.184981 Transcript_116992/m.184981 type:complete len:499 (+) Transcript_116992:60-1556(+)
MGCGIVGKQYVALDSQSDNTPQVKATHAVKSKEADFRTHLPVPSSSRAPPPLPPFPKVACIEASGSLASRVRQPHVGAFQQQGTVSNVHALCNVPQLNLKHFEQLEVLDETPMSLIVRLRNRQTGFTAAGKRIRKGCKTHTSGDYANEANILQKLAAIPGIVGLQGVCDDSIYFWTVLEFCAGGRLEPWLKRAPETSNGITRELLGIVKQLHAMLICHLDLKPDNVLLTDAGNVRICDFVTACQLSAREQEIVGNCGTEGFKAPEVISGKPYCGLPADVFSLGRTLSIVLQFTPNWHDLRKICRDMTSEDPKKRPDVESAFSVLFHSRTDRESEAMEIDLASLETVPCNDVRRNPTVGTSLARSQTSWAQAPEMRSKWDTGRDEKLQAYSRALSAEDLASSAHVNLRAKAAKQVSFQEAPSFLQKAPASKLPQGRLLQASVPKSIAMPDRKAAMQKSSPACGSTTCTRVGVCLCDDRPPLVHSQPSHRPSRLRRSSTP